MDAKGENIYRPRPYWYVLETLTRKRLFSSKLEDDLTQLPDQDPDRGGAVTQGQRMMVESQAFIQANYVPVGPVCWKSSGHILPSESRRIISYKFRHRRSRRPTR